MAETETFTIEGPDGTDELELPVDLIDALGEPGDSRTTVVGDMMTLALAQQAHAVVHHGQGDAGQDLEEAEQTVLDLFEERFGISFAEATGHSH